MSEKGYIKRRKLKKGIAKFCFTVVGLYILILIVLCIINVITSLTGNVSALEPILETIFYYQDIVISYIVKFFSLPYVTPIIGTIILFVMLFKLFIRGYWKLIFRPWVMLTSVATLAFTYYVWFYTHFSIFNIGAFLLDSPASLFLALLSFLESSIPSISYQVKEISYFVVDNIKPYLPMFYPAASWFILMFLMSRLTALFQSTFYFDEIYESNRAVEAAREVVKEARKITKSIPKHIIFYLQRGEELNACAFDHNKVAMTESAMHQKDDVIRAIIGHELGHIANKDVSASSIAGANLKLMWGLFTIPYFLLSSQADKKGRVKVNILTFLLSIFALIGALIMNIINVVHYCCYILGGKVVEYKADIFSSKLGYGAGLLAFMLYFYDVPAGGIKDPHPSMQNRTSYICDYIISHPKIYSQEVIEEAQKVKEDPYLYRAIMYSRE